MPNIKYVLQRITQMDYKSMIDTAKKVHMRSGKNTMSIFFDMIKCGFQYQAGYMDYWVFEFETLTPAQRATYITRGQNNRYVRLLNKKESWYKISDKVNFLKIFDGYHGRDWMDLREHTPQEFEVFCQQHSKIVAKLLDGSCGRGIEFFETGDKSKIVGLYDMLLAGKRYLVEEYLTQHEQINKLYPMAVNTIRLVTIKNGDTVHLVFACIRIGNGKEVDNLNSGGMAALIDMETGKISTPAADKNGKAYDIHPLTKVKLIGYPLPFFQEGVELVKKAALLIPDLAYVGWDVAVTPTGPVLIEANEFPGHDLYQFQVQLGPDKIGLMPRFDKACEGLAPVNE
ncbi:sugar-transfer associated ATP-grasp domain-containing protein [Youxingia wuxianensis]|uniref:Alpha-L-glutamate ligase-related protein ATP-grasp domain-containing protein n=1 Tax=Youxingia wuxianensis TaxID=2763678 RepID=A0A926ELR9_9FIRM|nr:sugar-transfer associated ATP-grasp domain-containing protein [Youxingia wuxianensis]MBC8584705.1 hypothetical protein [Youxingia wuxianensis]